jgi:penicillin-binding protein 2
MLYGALVEKVVRPGQRLVPCTGGYRFGNRRFRCWRPAGHGSLEAVGALTNSCDVYFYQLGPPLGVEGIARYARLFGFDAPSGIDLPQERSSLIPDTAYFDRRYGKQGWGPGATLNLIIGQGEILVSPVQLAQMTAVLATNRRPRPRLVLALGPEGRERPTRPPSLAPEVTIVPLEAEPLAIVRTALRETVASGTGRNAIVPGVAVAGKTGTAQNPGFDHALFIAYAPAEAPEVAVAVVLENRGHGGSVAAPVAQRVLAAYFGVTAGAFHLVGSTD